MKLQPVACYSSFSIKTGNIERICLATKSTKAPQLTGYSLFKLQNKQEKILQRSKPALNFFEYHDILFCYFYYFLPAILKTRQNSMVSLKYIFNFLLLLSHFNMFNNRFDIMAQNTDTDYQGNQTTTENNAVCITYKIYTTCIQ